jgi:hypothetical protein
MAEALWDRADLKVTSKKSPESRPQDAMGLLAKLCWEFVKHREKAKNGQNPRLADGGARANGRNPWDSVDFPAARRVPKRPKSL